MQFIGLNGISWDLIGFDSDFIGFDGDLIGNLSWLACCIASVAKVVGTPVDRYIAVGGDHFVPSMLETIRI